MDAPEKIALRWELGAAVTNGPLMTHPDYTRFIRADMCADPALLAEAVEVLRWYGEQARLARLIHSEGDAGRHAIDADGGKRARAFIAKLENRHE